MARVDLTNSSESTTSDPPGRSGVLHAAAELFVAQGYAGTTVRQIADQAGIKAGSVYHHFASKEALFVAVLHEGIEVMIEAFDETSRRLGEAADASAVEPAVHEHVRAHLSAVFEHGPFTTAHVTAFFNAPTEVRAAVVPERDRYEDKWNELLEALFPEMNIKALRLHRLILFGAMNASAEWFDPSGNLTLDQLASTISDQFLHGVRP